ncbi:MAG: EI24 domain-containing protein [Candidatus Entotheonellia bacterium]
MLSALLKTLSQLKERHFWSVVGRSLLLTFATFIALAGLVWWGLAHVSLFDLWWLNVMVEVLGGLSVLVLTWLLFPSVASLMVSFFLENMIVAVERRHYPHLPAPHPLPLAKNLGIALKFAGVTILLTLATLPLYLIPVLNLVVFYGVGGYLLGREYFELVALRRLAPASARAMRKAHQGRLFLAGVVVTFLLTLPIVNLLAPLLGTAFMVHVFEELRGERSW